MKTRLLLRAMAVASMALMGAPMASAAPFSNQFLSIFASAFSFVGVNQSTSSTNASSTTQVGGPMTNQSAFTANTAVATASSTVNSSAANILSVIQQ